MKKILLALLIVSFCLTAGAKDFALFNKETGEGCGITSIKEDYVSSWAKDFILKEADKSYKGKMGYEIILEQGKLRHATEQEIEDYIAQKEQEQQNAITEKKKQDLLDLLDDEDVKTKVKNIKNL